MDLRKLKKLIDLVEESGIAEIEVTEGEEKVRITRTTAAAAPIYAAPAPAAAVPVAAPAAAPAAAARRSGCRPAARRPAHAATRPGRSPPLAVPAPARPWRCGRPIPAARRRRCR